MAYTPTTWVEKQTKLGPTNLNKLEDGTRDAYTQAHGVYNVKDVAYGAKGDDITDDTAAIQAAIAAATASGAIVLVPPGTYAISSTITLANDVTVKLSSGATIKWVGSAGGTMFTSSTTDPLLRSNFVGPGTIDPNASAGVVFDLHSPQFCVIGQVDVLAGTASTVVMQIFADTTNVSTFTGTRNAVYNKIDHIYANGTIGNLLVLQGQLGTTGVVTLNTFSELHAEDVRGVGIRFVQWCDTNHFKGVVRLSLNANNAVGVIWNDSATPTSNVGVYVNNFDNLAVDTFGTFTGRVGIKLNNTKEITVHRFEQGPVAEGGSAVIDATAVSYSIGYTSDAATIDVNAIETWIRGINFVQTDANATPLGVKANSSAVVPEVRVQNIANGGTAQFSVLGKTAGGTQITGVLSMGAGGSVLLGATSNHPALFLSNNAETFRATTAGIQLPSGKAIIYGGGSGPTITSGSGAPSGSAPSGSIYLRTDGSAGSRIYVNQNGSTTWTAISGV